MSLERRAAGRVPLKTKLARAVWIVTSVFLFRPFGTPLFRLWRNAILRLFGARVDWSANVYSSASIWAPWHLHLGPRACLGPHVVCYNQATVTLGVDAIVSQYSYLCTASHDTNMMNTASSSLITSPINIGSSAWVAARAYVGPGVTIGEGAVVGATASVYKDVEPWTVVGGNPAKFIKRRAII